MLERSRKHRGSFQSGESQGPGGLGRTGQLLGQRGRGSSAGTQGWPDRSEGEGWAGRASTATHFQNRGQHHPKQRPTPSLSIYANERIINRHGDAQSGKGPRDEGCMGTTHRFKCALTHWGRFVSSHALKHTCLLRNPYPLQLLCWKKKKKKVSKVYNI